MQWKCLSEKNKTNVLKRKKSNQSAATRIDAHRMGSCNQLNALHWWVIYPNCQLKLTCGCRYTCHFCLSHSVYHMMWHTHNHWKLLELIWYPLHPWLCHICNMVCITLLLYFSLSLPLSHILESLPSEHLQCIQMWTFRWNNVIYFKYVNNVASKYHRWNNFIYFKYAKSKYHKCYVWMMNATHEYVYALLSKSRTSDF